MSCEKYVLRGPEPLHPLQPGTAGQQMYDSLLKFAHLPEALIDAHTNRSVSYYDILKTSCRLAQSLSRNGLVKDSVITICSENNLEFFYPVIASLYLGVIVAPLNDSYNERELHHAMQISKPQLVFCSKKTMEKMLSLQEKFPGIRKIVVLDLDEDVDRVESLRTFIELNSDKNFDVANFQPKEFNRDEQVAAILCSSGTTGLPKGVMLTHKNFAVRFAHAKDPQTGSQVAPGTTVLSFLPLFHSFGLMTVLGYITVGLRTVIMKFDGELFLKTIEMYKIESVMVAPPIMVFLAKHPLIDKYDLSSLKEIVCGAAPLGNELREAVKRRLKLNDIRQGYGFTEMTLALTFTADDIIVPGSSGTLLPFISAKVVDPETGKALGPGNSGELCFQGPMMMKGYAENAEATREIIDKDGWLHSGDIGYYDQKGNFFIVDRLKELIKYKGFQVAPAELEALLLEHPKVKDAAVIGIPDDLAGELPAAFIVKQSDVILTEEEIKEFVAGKVSYTKQLRGGVQFLDEIPKNPSGKILRRLLRDAVRHGKWIF